MKSYILQKNDKLSGIINEIIYNNFPQDFIKLWLNSELILANDTIRQYFENKEINKLDFFCLNSKVFALAKEILVHNNFNQKFDRVHFAKFLHDNYQINIVFLPSANDIIDILENFGFTIEKIAYYKNALIIHKRFFKDLEAKKLVYSGASDPKESYRRYSRLEEVGYTIDKTDLKLIEEDISESEH